MGTEAILPVQEIALLGNEVPREFLVTQEVQRTLQNPPRDRQDDGLQLPVIDLGPLFEATAEDGCIDIVKEEIGKACEEWGFFQVLNHGVPQSLLERVLGVVQGFFDLPLEEKQKHAMKRGATQGYGRVMKPKIRPWSDAFRHNVWPRLAPEQDFRPQKPTEYREVMGDYTKEVVKLIRILTGVLSEYLGLDRNSLLDGLEKERGDYPKMTITVNLYPKCPQPDRVLGLYPHSDAGIMTVLYQSPVDGLQVLRGEKWVTVKPKKDALVVNVADQLQILSNGRFTSSKHRAIVNSSSSRLSIAAFCGPGSPDIVIGPKPVFVDSTHPPLYPTMAYSEYCSSYFNRDMEAKPLTFMGSLGNS